MNDVLQQVVEQNKWMMLPNCHVLDLCSFRVNKLKRRSDVARRSQNVDKRQEGQYLGNVARCLICKTKKIQTVDCDTFYDSTLFTASNTQSWNNDSGEE